MQHPPHPHLGNRRQVLQSLAGLAGAWAAPMAFAQGSGRRVDAEPGRLVLILLRGAYDGLSALVPYADPDYYARRPTIAIPAPDGTTQTALRLDAGFGLHPAMAALMPLWQQSALAFVPAAGSPDPTRSHFDAQYHFESGMPGRSSSLSGWMNRLAGLPSERGNTSVVALAVGEANPAILSGASAVQRVPRGQAATRSGALAYDQARQAVLELYAGDDALSRNFRAGAQSRMQSAETLRNDVSMSTDPKSAEMQAANNGAGPARGLLLDARHLGTLMRAESGLRLGFLSAGGWDTHANQGSTSGSLANNLASLAATLVQLRQDFSRSNDVIVVASEFGRTCAENGTRGTDHGHGNAMWLVGSRVRGGRWHGAWDGLANGNLHEGRDLPVRNDYRAVLAQVLRATQGVDVAGLDELFPGFAWDRSLDAMFGS
ncbi:MAG: DUF1501 domain-containing protein [Burkholderiaceae bacterium]